MLKELTSYLATTLSLTIGQQIFAGPFPDGAPDQIAAILEPGMEKDNFYLPGTFEKAIQIYTRSRDYFSARQLAESLRDALSGARNAVRTLPALTSGGDTYQINIAETISGPSHMGMDPKGRAQFSTNILLRVQKL